MVLIQFLTALAITFIDSGRVKTYGLAILVLPAKAMIRELMINPDALSTNLVSGPRILIN
jgi:hypothetical protein